MQTLCQYQYKGKHFLIFEIFLPIELSFIGVHCESIAMKHCCLACYLYRDQSNIQSLKFVLTGIFYEKKCAWQNRYKRPRFTI